jgi:hypothetical protein
MLKKTYGLCQVLLLICGMATAQQLKWHVPTYQGLRLGKAKRVDVERTFGKPAWSGHPEDEYDNPVENMLSYEYENVGGFEGRTVIWMKARTGVVTDIILYPPYQKPLPSKGVLEKLGADYIERESALGPCPTAKEVRKFNRMKRREYPIFLVYPRKGMYVAVDANGNVQDISYMLRCT